MKRQHGERTRDEVARSVSVGPAEEALMAGRLAQLREELLSGSAFDRAAFDLARLLSSDYINSDYYMLLFLRSNSFNIKSAAQMLVRHFQKKLELFGPTMLVRSIALPDLSADDQASLSSGGVLILPEKDPAGRPIFVIFYSRVSYKERLNLVRYTSIGQLE